MEEILLKMKIAKTIYIICAFVPIIIFIAAYRMKRSETVGFVIGLAANTGVYFAGIFSLIAAAAFQSRVLEIICLAAIILIPMFLYYSILVKYISEAKIAVSFSLGMSQASMLFCVLIVNLSADDFIWREQEKRYEGTYYTGGYNKLFAAFLIMAAVKIILIVMSACAARKIYSSKKFTPERKAVISSVIMVISGICADLLLIKVT